MLNRFAYLALAIIMAPIFLNAQTIEVKGIEIYGQNLSATDDLGVLSALIANTKNPAFFKTNGLVEFEEESRQYANGFTIDFQLMINENSSNEYIIGIHAGNIETYFGTTASIQFDSLAANTSVLNKSEYFRLHAGYQRVFRTNKKLKFTVGGILNFGIPVSSITTQKINTEFFPETYQFFGKQSPLIGLSVPLSARLKLVRNVSISLTSRPTFTSHRADGNRSSTVFQGTHLSLHFRLRNQ